MNPEAPDVFLIADRGQGYLVSYNRETKEIGLICPCCMFDNHRIAIMSAVEQALAAGEITGKILWCDSGRDDDPRHYYGDTLAKYPPLKQECFKGGSAEEISAEMRALLHEAALKVSAPV